MIVMVVLVGATLLARLAGLLGVEALDGWRAAARVGLSAMLCLTASAHFTAMRHDLVKMMPKGMPWPMGMVWLTGVCEIAGAVGLQVPSVRRAAAIALVAFFAAILPANVKGAREGATLGGKPVTSLVWRIPMQILFIGIAWWVGVAA